MGARERGGTGWKVEMRFSVLLRNDAVVGVSHNLTVSYILTSTKPSNPIYMNKYTYIYIYFYTHI